MTSTIRLKVRKPESQQHVEVRGVGFTSFDDPLGQQGHEGINGVDESKASFIFGLTTLKPCHFCSRSMEGASPHVVLHCILAFDNPSLGPGPNSNKKEE